MLIFVLNFINFTQVCLAYIHVYLLYDCLTVTGRLIYHLISGNSYISEKTQNGTEYLRRKSRRSLTRMTKMIRRGQYTRNVSEEIAPPIKENTRGKKNSATILYCIQLRYCVKRQNERTLIATFCKNHWHPPPLPKFYIITGNGVS